MNPTEEAKKRNRIHTHNSGILGDAWVCYDSGMGGCDVFNSTILSLMSSRSTLGRGFRYNGGPTHLGWMVTHVNHDFEYCGITMERLIERVVDSTLKLDTQYFRRMGGRSAIE